MCDLARLLFDASFDALSGKNLQVFNTRFDYLRGGEARSYKKLRNRSG